MRFLVILFVTWALSLAFATTLQRNTEINSTSPLARKAVNQCGYYPFFDISPGKDLSSFLTPDITSCCEECQRHLLCRGFTYEQDQPNVNCFLKTETDLVPTNKPTVAGISPEWTSIEIRVYSATNHEGSPNTIQISSFQPCVKSVFFIVKSINSFGSCVRIYENPDCTGRTRSLVSPEHADRDFDLIGFPNFKGSFGLCLPHDVCGDDDAGICQGAEPKAIQSSTILVKQCDITRHRLTTEQAIFIGVAVIANLVRLNDPSNPIMEYEHDGNHRRTEYLHARIWPDHLDTGTATNDRTRSYCRNELNGYYNHPTICDDDAGHIVGRQLGGTGTETYNIFPQNLSVNRGLWNQIEKLIKRSLHNCEDPYASVQLRVRLLYNRMSNRTVGFWFRVELCDGSVIENVLENYENGRTTYWWSGIDID